MLRHRVTGLTSRAPLEPVIPALWEIAADGLMLNGRPSTPGERLVPGRGGSRRISQPGAKPLSLASPWGFPDDALGDRLADLTALLERGRSSWEDWTGAPLLLGSTDEEMRLSPAERGLENNLDPVQRVVHRPRTYLRPEADIVAADRAQRIARRAEIHLAVHPENWARKSARGVTPLRVLAMFPEPDYDLYENRVAVGLVRELRVRLPARIDKLLAYEEQHRCVLSGTPAKCRRTAEVWGASVAAQQGNEALTSTLGVLRALHEAVRSLSRSPLARRLRSAPTIRPPLRATNILTHDDDYRTVGMLWRAWMEQTVARDVDDAAIIGRRQQACRDYDDYCLAAVLRALRFLGFAPPDPGTVVPSPGRLGLVGPTGDATLELDKRGAIRVSFDGAGSVELVPVYDHLTADASPQEIRARIDALHAGPACIVLFPAEDRLLHESEHGASEALPKELVRELQGIPRDRPPGQHLVHATPHDLLAVERIGRILRAEAWGPALLRGFPVLDAPTLREQLDREPAWASWSGSRLRVVRPETPEERSRVIAAYARADRALQSQGGRAATARGWLDGERRLVLAALRDTLLAVTCPHCARESTQSTVGEDDGYVVTCGACEAQWGVSRCSRCRSRAPWLLPPGAGDFDGRPGATERVAGLDAIVPHCCGRVLWRRRWIAEQLLPRSAD